jgi:hypothetical protein
MMSPASLVFVVLLAGVCGCAPPGGGGERPAAKYDARTGKLQRLVFDSDADGRNDAVGNMDGARVTSIETDSTRNGVTDRWDFFDSAGRLASVGLSRQDDGIMDAVAIYGANQQLLRLNVSTHRDGRFDRTEFYELGILARAEEDTDGDGRIDKWESHRPNPRGSPGEPPTRVSMVAFDDSATGRPTRRLIYAPDGTTRVEIARADGTFPTSATRQAVR